MMFRFAFVALAFVTLGAILAGGIEAASLVFAPLFIVAKVLFFMLFVGVIGGMLFRNHGDRRQRPPWSQPSRLRPEDEGPQRREELFEEWHRVAHAREEVDTWVEDLD